MKHDPRYSLTKKTDLNEITHQIQARHKPCPRLDIILEKIKMCQQGKYLVCKFNGNIAAVGGVFNNMLYICSLLELDSAENTEAEMQIFRCSYKLLEVKSDNINQ